MRFYPLLWYRLRKSGWNPSKNQLTKTDRKNLSKYDPTPATKFAEEFLREFSGVAISGGFGFECRGPIVEVDPLVRDHIGEFCNIGHGYLICDMYVVDNKGRVFRFHFVPTTKNYSGPEKIRIEFVGNNGDEAINNLWKSKDLEVVEEFEVNIELDSK